MVRHKKIPILGVRIVLITLSIKNIIGLQSWILSLHPVWPFKGVSFCP